MKKTALAIVTTTLLLGSTAEAIVVSSTDDASTLAGSILGSGITLVSSSLTSASGSTGTFSGGTSSGLDFDSGIVLTTGQASTAATPQGDDSATTNNGVAGSSALDALIPGFSTLDATILDIVFTTTGGDLFFNFIFASEEYNEFVGSSYNDVFGFFVDGTDVSDNIALIPGTSTPIAISNVNNSVNSEYFNDNDPSDLAPVPYPDFQYDGFTTSFTVSALGLGAGTHTISLQIADAGDDSLDSAVFIQASTFSDTPTDPKSVPDSGATVLLLAIGAAAIRAFRKLQ